MIAIVATGALGKAVLHLSDMRAPIEGMSKLARNARDVHRCSLFAFGIASACAITSLPCLTCWNRQDLHAS